MNGHVVDRDGALGHKRNEDVGINTIVAQIQENPYLQYFVGLPGYQMEAPFAPSLFVEIRKRMGSSVFEVFHRAFIAAVDQAKANRPSQPARCAAPAKDDDDPPPATGGGMPELEEPDHPGKLDKAVEFGAKLSVSLSAEGLARVDQLRWNVFHEGGDLVSQVEAFRSRYGVYPEAVLGNPIYGTRANRRYLKNRGIRFAGKPLGRPRKVTDKNREELKRLQAQRREEYRQRIPTVSFADSQSRRRVRRRSLPRRKASDGVFAVRTIFWLCLSVNFIAWK